MEDLLIQIEKRILERRKQLLITQEKLAERAASHLRPCPLLFQYPCYAVPRPLFPFF